MQWLLRIVCFAYFVFLTLLLLTRDPGALIGCHEKLPWILEKLMPLAHAISFFVLAVFALTPRWPVPRWGFVLTLAIYGGMTEVLQGYVPGRTPAWADWFQDLTGVMLGTACCWGVAMLLAALPAARPSAVAVAVEARRRMGSDPQTSSAFQGDANDRGGTDCRHGETFLSSTP